MPSNFGPAERTPGRGKPTGTRLFKLKSGLPIRALAGTAVAPSQKLRAAWLKWWRRGPDCISSEVGAPTTRLRQWYGRSVYLHFHALALALDAILKVTAAHALIFCRTLREYKQALLQDEVSSDTQAWSNATKLLSLGRAIQEIPLLRRRATIVRTSTITPSFDGEKCASTVVSASRVWMRRSRCLIHACYK